MKNVFIITSADLRNPNRGTPIRILNFISQIMRGGFSVTLIANDAGGSGASLLIPPTQNFIKKFIFCRNLIIEKEIDWIFTPTFSDIKMAILLKIFTGTKLAIDIHGLSHEEDYYAGNISFLRKIEKKFLQSIYLAFCNKIFVVSKKMADYYRLSIDTSVVVYGGVSLGEFPHIARYVQNSSDLPFEITYMGNARNYQGLPILLDAVQIFGKENPFFVLRLILSSDTDEVRKILKEKNLLEHSIIHESVDHTKIHELLRSSDVLVIPRPSLAITEYAYPTKLPECMATGVPVLTTEVGPVKELLENEVNCVVVQSDSIESLASGLKKIYDFSPEIRKSLGVSARGYVEDYLQWNKIGDNIRSVFMD